MKSALVAFAGIVAEAGNDTSVLLLASCTPTPPLGAGALKATVHVSDPGAVRDDWLQDNVLGMGDMSATTCDPHPDSPARDANRRQADPRTVPANHSFECAEVDDPFNIRRRRGLAEGKG